MSGLTYIYIVAFIHENTPIVFAFNTHEDAVLFASHIRDLYELTIEGPYRELVTTYDEAIEAVVSVIGPSK